MNVDEIAPLKEEDGSEEKEEAQQEPESDDKVEKPIVNQVKKSQIGCLCSVVGSTLNFNDPILSQMAVIVCETENVS